MARVEIKDKRAGMNLKLFHWRYIWMETQMHVLDSLTKFVN